jgi:hypothetical protein
MSIPLPSLNLNFEKKSSTQTQNTNDNSARNSCVVYIIQPTPRKNIQEELEVEMEEPVVKSRSKPNNESKRNTKYDGFEDLHPYMSPTFEEVHYEFKDTLLSIMEELLLNDVDLIKNVFERGKKILLHKDQLKQLIAILYLSKEDRLNYENLILIDTEKVVISSCFCKDCVNPFYERIKNIFITNDYTNFLTTQHAVNMTTLFKINLELCLK